MNCITHTHFSWDELDNMSCVARHKWNTIYIYTWYYQERVAVTELLLIQKDLFNDRLWFRQTNWNPSISNGDIKCTPENIWYNEVYKGLFFVFSNVVLTILSKRAFLMFRMNIFWILKETYLLYYQWFYHYQLFQDTMYGKYFKILTYFPCFGYCKKKLELYINQ